MGMHVYSAIQKELHSFALEESALRARVANPEIRAAGAALLDHALTGHSGTVGVVMHRPPHGSRRARRSEQPGDLAIGGHPPSGDAPHECIYPVEETSRPWPRPDSPRRPRPASRLS